MGPERIASRTPAVAERRPAMVHAPLVPAAHATRTGAMLQQRLGNQGARAFAAQVVSRAGDAGGVLGGASLGEFSVSHPDDAHEREAERVADVVMRSAEPGAVPTTASTPSVQRACAKCEVEMEAHDSSGTAEGAAHLNRAGSGSESEGATQVASNIHDMQGGGTPLPASTRAFFEPRFGADFRHVRVHTGSRADATAKAVSAKAFTVGSDIVFAGGQFSPESKEGQHLLAHELTHVVQQDGGASRVSRQVAHVEGISALANAPTIHRFDLPWGYETDFSWEGVKTAAGVVRDKAEDALDWVVEQITELANEAKEWLLDQWEGLKGLMHSAFDAAKAAFSRMASLFLGPLGLLGQALMRLDPAALKKTWMAFAAVVTRVGEGFKTMAATLLRPFEFMWNGINKYATWVLDRLAGLLGNFVFRKLPNIVQRGARALVDGLKAIWKAIHDGWTALSGEIKAWINAAIDTVTGFVRKVLEFAIDTVIATLIKIGQAIMFLKDFVADPMRYIAILGKRCVQALEGVENRFEGVVSQYFGRAKDTPAPATAAAAPVRISREPAAGAGEARTSASWGEIGDGVLGVMDEKWEAFKASPMTVVLGLLRDLFLPLVGDVEDVIKLYHDIKDIVTNLNFDSLHDLWTSLLQILDIPIQIYNTIISILMRTLMLPLLIASFVPAAREAAMAIGYGLLIDFLYGVGANLTQKLLLLKTGATVRSQKKAAYNSIADNLIALALTAVIALLMVLLPAIYGLMKGIFNFVKGKVFGIKVPTIEVKAPPPDKAPAPPDTASPPDKKPPPETKSKPVEPAAAKPDRIIICRACVELKDVPRDILDRRAKLSPEMQAYLDKRIGRIVGDPTKPTAADFQKVAKVMDAIEKAGGNDLEKGLQAAYARENPAAKPPSGVGAAELPLLRKAAEQLLADLEAFASRSSHPAGIQKMAKRLTADMEGVLAKMETGGLEATAERIQGFKNNLKGVETEFNSAKVAPAGTKFGEMKSGQEIDRISPDELRWTNDKGGNRFGETDPRYLEVEAQAKENLAAAQRPENLVGGKAPEIEFHFPDGVTPEVAAKLRKVTVGGQSLIVTGPEIPL
jgi:hypothetical protein